MKVACAIVLREDRVLVQSRLRQGQRVREFPMGQIDEGETAEEAAVRELEEETSLKGKASRIVRRQNKVGDEIYFVFLEVETGRSPTTDLQRQQEYLWLRWGQIPLDDFHECDREFIKEMIDSRGA